MDVISIDNKTLVAEVFDGSGSIDSIGKVFSKIRFNDRSVSDFITIIHDDGWDGSPIDERDNASSIFSQQDTISKSLGYQVFFDDVTMYWSLSYKQPFHVMRGKGLISTYEPAESYFADKELCSGMLQCYVFEKIINKAYDNENIVGRKYNTKLPNVPLNKRIIYIKKFDVYITALPISVLEEIRDGRSRFNELPLADTTAPIKVSLTGNVDSLRTMYYYMPKFDIICRTTVEPLIGDEHGKVEITINDQGNPRIISRNIPNDNFISMDQSAYIRFNDCGGLDIYFDYNPERLQKTRDHWHRQPHNQPLDVTTKVVELEQELSKLSNELESRIRERDVLKNKNIVLEGKINLESSGIAIKKEKLGLKKEKVVVKKEKIKHNGEKESNRSNQISDEIKLVGATVAVTGVIFGAMYKLYSSTSASAGLVEWATTMFGNKPANLVVGLATFSKGIAETVVYGVTTITGMFTRIVEDIWDAVSNSMSICYKWLEDMFTSFCELW